MVDIIDFIEIFAKHKEAEEAELRKEIVSAIDLETLKEICIYVFKDISERLEFVESYIFKHGIGYKKIQATIIKLLEEKEPIKEDELHGLLIKRLREDLKL